MIEEIGYGLLFFSGFIIFIVLVITIPHIMRKAVEKNKKESK